MNRPLRSVVVVALPLVMAVVASAEMPAIGRLAPDSTVVVAGVHNAEATVGRLKKTNLWALWESREIREMRQSAMDDSALGLEELMSQLGLEEDAMQPPTGTLGVALFSVMDRELGLPGPAFLALAEYGDRADKTSELLERALEKASKDDELTYIEKDVQGRNVYCIDVPQPDAEDMNLQEDPFMPPGMGDMFAPDEIMAGIETIYLAREKDSFMVCTDLEALRGAFEVCDGDKNDTLDQRDDFRGISSQFGQHDAYMVMLTRDLGDLVSAFDTMGMMMMIGPMFGQLIGDMDGVGVGVRIDGPTAMLEQTIAVHMPNGLSGVPALLDQETPRGRVPSFVGPNTISYTSVNFEFGGLPRAVKPVLDFMQQMMAMGPAGEQDAPSPTEMLRDVCSALGEKVHIVNMCDRPIASDSLKQVIAVECPKPEKLERMMQTTSPDIEGRDFLGHRIYRMDPDMMAMAPVPGMDMMGEESMSIGFGGGYAFLGQTEAIEQALRTVGQSDAGTIEDDPLFRRAAAVLGDDLALAWTYTDMIQGLEAQNKIERLQVEAFIKEIREDDPEMADEMMQGHLEEMGPMAKMDFKMLRRYIGPSIGAWRVTDTGFVGRFFTLAANNDG